MFKLSFIQLICKASLGFKSNLGLALSIILKEKNYTSQMFKNTRLVILFYIFLNPSFEMMTGFPNVGRTAASTSKFMT